MLRHHLFLLYYHVLEVQKDRYQLDARRLHSFPGLGPEPPLYSQTCSTHPPFSHVSCITTTCRPDETGYATQEKEIRSLGIGLNIASPPDLSFFSALLTLYLELLLQTFTKSSDHTSAHSYFSLAIPAFQYHL